MTQADARDIQIVELRACLVRLSKEIDALDQLGASLAALKISEACDLTKDEIDRLLARDIRTNETD